MDWVMIGMKLTIGYVLVGIVWTLSILALFGCWLAWQYVDTWLSERKLKRRQP